MVAIAPNPSPAPERAIHRTREANREAADSARERVFICGLRDEMDMVVLENSMTRNGPFDDAASAQRYVHRMRRLVRGARAVWNARASAGAPFASRASSTAAPCRRHWEC